jgi:hypothetical protein
METITGIIGREVGTRFCGEARKEETTSKKWTNWEWALQ